MTPAKIICVLGMHRSGTSVVSRLIQMLGAYAGPERHRMEPAPDNPKGFWEHRELAAINDEILARFGGSWDNPPVVPDGWELSAQLADLRQRALDAVAEDFGETAFWSWKDPRTSLTLPFWQRVLPSMRYVICLRNPAGVARSLQQRNAFSIRKGGELWLAYTTSAFRWTSQQPRLLVFYEDVMQNRERELSRLSAFLDTIRPLDSGFLTEVSEFFEEELFHHRPRISQGIDDPDLPFPAKSLYLALRTRHANADKNGQAAELDSAIELFSAQAREHQATEEREAQNLAVVRATLIEAQRQTQELGMEEARLRHQLSTVEADRTRLQLSVQQQCESLSEANASRAGLEQTIEELHNSLSEVTSDRDKRIVEHEEAAAHLVALGVEQQRLSAEAETQSAIIRRKTRRIRAFEARLDARQAIASSHTGSRLETAASTLSALGTFRGPMSQKIRRTISLAVRTARFQDAYLITQSGVFDEAYYRGRYPDTTTREVAPLAHFVFHGAFEGRNPHPLFDSMWYRSENAQVTAEMNPLVHYLRYGALGGLAPHPLFDVDYYMRGLEGRTIGGSNALVDYIRRGTLEGRSPHPLFDVDFYYEQNPDVAEAGIDPFAHFLTCGAAEGRDPHPFFNCSEYLGRNPDVRERGLNPLEHFMSYGWREGRWPCSSFDPSFYLAAHDDVRRAGINPLLHYVQHGQLEARKTRS